MKPYWKRNTDVEHECYQLCVPPAALLLTLNRGDKYWILKCLGETVQLAGPGLPAPKAKEFAVDWMITHLMTLTLELQRGIQS